MLRFVPQSVHIMLILTASSLSVLSLMLIFATPNEVIFIQCKGLSKCHLFSVLECHISMFKHQLRVTPAPICTSYSMSLGRPIKPNDTCHGSALFHIISFV